MSAEAPTFSVGTTIGSARPSIGSDVTSLSGGSQILESFSNVMSAPKLKVNPSGFSMDTISPTINPKMEGTITVIKRPTIFDPPTETVPVAGKIEPRLPDVKTLTPEPINLMVENSRPTQKMEGPITTVESPQETEPKVVEPVTTEESLRTQEAAADAKLAQELIVQIESSPALSEEQRANLVEDVKDIVDIKTDDLDVQEPQEIAQARLAQIEQEVQDARPPEILWETFQGEQTIIVDEENEIVDTQTNLKPTGLKRTDELEYDAQAFAAKGVERMVKIRNLYLEGEITTHLKDLQAFNQKAA